MLSNGGQIVFFVTVITLVSEGAFELTSQKKLNKRYEVDFPTCLENFDIHTDTIIRAQDSRAIGGRYINETEVSSREECLKLCCQTSLCDVFIFEEKSPGSCYLFDCGSSDDFKCKFNPHRHYTSGVMAVNRHVAELESQVKLSKHEEELAGLRKSLQATLVQHTTVVALPTQTAPTTSTSTQKPAAPSTAVQPNQANSSVTGRKCSRYQFECRTSGECIAIYNACDGIPQCADGSDEGPELACPSPASTVPPPPPAPPSIVIPQHGQPEGPQNFNPQFRQPPAQPMWPAASWQQQQPPKSAADFAQQPSPVQHPQQLNPAQAPYQQPIQQQQVPPEPRKFYSREGDYGGVHDPQAQWPAQQFQNSGPMNPVPQTFHRPGTYPGAEYEDPQNSHIFNHKGGVLLNDPDGGSSGYGGYGAAEKPGGGPYYNGPGFHQPQAQPPQHEQQQWQRPRISSQDHETLLGHSVEDDLRLGSHAHFGAPPLQPPSSQQQAPAPVGAAPDYYNYEEGGPQQRFHHHQMHQQPPLAMETKSELKVQHRPPALMEGQSEAVATVEAPSKPNPALDQRAPASPEHPQSQVTSESTTEHPLEVAHSNSHYSGEGSKKKALPPHMPPPLDPEALQFPDGSAAKPGGAYLSLSVGLTVTALLVVLISCRLRVVRRRLRRGGGKSPYAHDADFLVNGMYL